MRYEGFQDIQQLFGRPRLSYQANIVGIRHYLGYPNVKKIMMVSDNDIDQRCPSRVARCVDKS